MDALQQSLSRFGLSAFRPGQRAVMEHLLAGRSAAAVFPTGGGKSLCYQLPALLIDGLTVVVSPLIALMKDQIDALHHHGIAAARLDSSLSREAYRDVIEGVRDGTLRLLYVAPERFNNERFRAMVSSCRIGLLAIDEAHCISEWGHNFRPDYLKLAGYAERFGAERVLALTATASDRVLDDICKGFDIAPECAIRTPFYRSNLELRFAVVSPEDQERVLVDRLAGDPRGPTIVYVTLQKTAERVAELLRRQGLHAAHYHAGLKPEEREGVQEQFMAAHDRVVVATIAFGMGIDKADIRRVVHFNPPKSLEGYAQEIGRAGRDGQPASCELLLCGRDLNALENFVYGDTPDRPAISSLVHELFDEAVPGHVLELDLYSLSRTCDIRALVLRTLLTRLELDVVLEAGTPVYTSHQLKPRLSSAELLGHYPEAERPFLRRVLSCLEKRRTWFHLDLDKAIAKTGGDRIRVIRALDDLEERQLVELRTAGVRHRYRVVRVPPDLEALADTLHADALRREAAELGRLAQVVALATSDTCQSSQLGAHFGQPLPEPCGHCSVCLGDSQHGVEVARPSGRVPEEVSDRIAAIAAEDDKKARALATPRGVARFLVGVTSPALSAARLTRHPLFGSLAEVPFARVLHLAGSGVTAPRAEGSSEPGR